MWMPWTHPDCGDVVAPVLHPGSFPPHVPVLQRSIPCTTVQWRTKQVLAVPLFGGRCSGRLQRGASLVDGNAQGDERQFERGRCGKEAP